MNYGFNKNARFYRRPNERYFIKLDKAEAQNNLNKNLNNFNNQNRINKSNNIYNSNFFALNRIINTKEIMINYNGLKNENSKKYPGVRASHSIENNLKYLNITNVKNIPLKSNLSSKKQIDDKDDNKNSDNNKESIPTIVKIQKLIESLQSKSTTNNTNKENNKDMKENNKLPCLINMPRHSIEENKPNIAEPKKSTINNINIFSTKDLISRINKTKIKLKQISYHKANKNININNDNKEKNQIKKTPQEKKTIIKVRKPKVSLDNIKNMIKQNYIVDNNGNKEKVVNIRLKLNPKQTRNYFNSNNSKIISNINNNTILINTKKESVKFCISNYNNFKSDLMGLKKTFHHIENERTKKESLVNKNQTMFKNPLNDKTYGKENQEDDDETENDPKRYSKYYLPSSGFGLLSRHNN